MAKKRMMPAINMALDEEMSRDKKVILYSVLLICLASYGNIKSETPNLINYIIGTNYNLHGWTIDYFPLLKNIPKVIIGILFGHFYIDHQIKLSNKLANHPFKIGRAHV